MDNVLSPQTKIIWNPEDIASLSAGDLSNPEIILQIEGMAVEFLNTQDFKNGGKLYEVLKQKSPESDVKYAELLRLLEIGQARFAPIAKRAPFFKDSILLLIKYGFAPQEIFDPGFIFSDTLGEDEKSVARQSFEDNQEVLGPDSVKNWILDYRKFLADRNLEADSFGKANYISQNQKYRGLQVDEKEYLSKLFDFYEWLHKPSLLQPLIIPRAERAAPIGPLPPAAPPPPPRPIGRGSPRPAPRPTMTPPGLSTSSRPPSPRQERDIMNITLPPVELRDRSTEGHREKLQITNYKLQTKPEIQIPKIQTETFLPPPPRPREKKQPRAILNEELYKSSLEELRKIREAAQKFQITSTKPQTIPKPQIPIPKPPMRPITPPRGMSGPPVSVNEELIRAGQSLKPAPPAPEQVDHEIEDKLHKLEERIE